MMVFLLTIFWLSIFFIVYSYILYPLFLLFWNWMMKPPSFELTDELPTVSILIAAYNEEKVIRHKIENCFLIDYPRERVEIIIASDGSSDKTVEIIKEYAAKGIILLDFKERRGKVNLLNDMVHRATRDILIFTDANSMFARDALKRLVRHFGDPKVGCVCGGLQFINIKGSQSGELEGFYWRYETILKKLEGRRGALLGANGAIYAVCRELFEPCPPDTIIDDFFIPMKLLQQGYAVLYDPEAIASEESTHKVIQEKERRIRIGAGDFQAFFRLWPMLNPLKGFPALAFWSHKVLRWFAPFFLMTAFITNLFFLGEPLYLFIFILQCLFYLAAFIGQILNWSAVGNRFFKLCYYFVSMNLALFLGFVRFVTNKQNVAWQRTER